jgi:hemerythrin
MLRSGGGDLSIVWTDDLATGVDDIDEQHRELYRHVAALHEAMKSGALHQARELVVFLRGYAVDHFVAEEQAMRAARYPGLDAHRQEHRRFVEEYEHHAERLSARASPTAIVELSSWLSDWLRGHVRGTDREMAAFLRAARAQAGVPHPRR